MIRRSLPWAPLVAVLVLLTALLNTSQRTPSFARSVQPTSQSAAAAMQTTLPVVYQQFLVSVGGSHFVSIDGTQMHYVEAGPRDRPTLLLLHGAPDNIFTWRTIIPALASQYHVVAPDLMGFGLSGHPDIHYTWAAEIHYLSEFISATHLHHVALVATDIGGLFGFAYADQHPENVAGIVLWETVTAPIASYDLLGSYCPTCVQFFQVPKDPTLAQQYIIANPLFAAQIYSGTGLLHPLSADELQGYSYFLATPVERRVVAQIGAQMPIAGEPHTTQSIASDFAQYMRTSGVPKLVLYANPGSILPSATAIGLGMPNTLYAPVGPGYHYLAEDGPAAIVRAIESWRATVD